MRQKYWVWNKKKKSNSPRICLWVIWIDPDKEGFEIFKAIDEIFRYIKQTSNQLTKKGLIAKISMRLLKLEFKSDNIIKPKAMKYIVEKNIARLWVKSSYFTLYKSNGNVLSQLLEKYCKQKFYCQKN